jgi:phosphomannomutase/phosphoglucomutase
VVREQGGTSVVVGRDNRASSVDSEKALLEGLTSTGLIVKTIGMVSTPVLYFAIHHLQGDGGIMITGSHNPKNFNGLKMSLGTSSLYGDAITDLYTRIEQQNFTTGQGRAEEAAVREPYLANLLGKVKLKKKWNIAVDCGNGTAGLYVEELFSRAGVTMTGLFLEPDADYPNHHPDPTVEKNMQDVIAAVKEQKADVGFAFDGDADRLGLVDENGRIVWGDEILVLLSRDLLGRLPGSPIIFEVKCSKRLADDIRKHGGKPEMWKAGHSLIKARMKELNAPLAGEMSGHLFFGEDYYGFDDPFLAALRLLAYMDATGKRPGELLGDLPPTFATPEMRVECTDEAKFAIVETLKQKLEGTPGADMNTIDGLRVEFPDGWGLVRASNTQPVLVTRFEAQSPERRDEIRLLVETALKDAMGVDELIFGGH